MSIFKSKKSAFSKGAKPLFWPVQEIWRYYLPPSEKKFYSTLREKNGSHHACSDDVALPLSLQKNFSWYLHP